RYNQLEKAMSHAAELIKAGAVILDVGAYSSRPGAMAISGEEECNRLVPFINELIKQFPEVIISVDTFRASVAKKAVNAGASIINDISGGSLDPDMFATVRRLNVPYIMMHMRGTPKTMQQLTGYGDIIADICTYFIE